MDKVAGCALCTDYTGEHQRDKCDATVKGKCFNNCSIQEGGKACGKKHNHLVHGTNVQFVNALKTKQEDKMSFGENILKADDSRDVLLKF